MSVSSIMVFEEGFNRGIRFRYISDSFKVDSYVCDKQSLLTSIERNMPNVVLMGLSLYAKIDGVKVSKEIRRRFDIPVIYKHIRLKVHPTTVWNWNL
jgi:glycine/serine hydroxymethyltransferase